MFINRKIDSDWNLALLFAGILLLLVLFNVLSGLFFGYAVWDATSDKRYNLSEPSINFLNNNETPITIRLYISRDLKQASARYGIYADYVNRMLNKYKEYSNGYINLEIVEITPYSSAEISAGKMGIIPLDIEDTGHDVYLGANFIRPDGEAFSIPTFSIKRKSMLEDDISRTLSRLSASKAPLIGVISPYFDVASSDRIIVFNDDWPFIKQLRAAGFRIKPLGATMSFIPEEIDAVLVYYPVDMIPLNLYAIDQYLLRGGNVMVMLDSFSELRFAENNIYTAYNSGMRKFLENIGVSYYDDILIGDLQNNQEINIDGKKMAYPLYMKIYPEQMANHPIMSRLQTLRLNYISPFNFDESKSGLHSTVLYSSGMQSGLIKADLAVKQSYDSLRQMVKSEDMQFPLALLLEGNFKAFYKVPMVIDTEMVLNMPIFINKAQAEGKLLLVGDSDMAAWSLWRGGSEDGKALFFSSDNVLFIRNALDYLSSSEYVNVGQKFISQNKHSLNDIIKKYAEEKNSTRRSQVYQQLSDVKKQLNKIYNASYETEFDFSEGRQRKIYDLEGQQQSFEQVLKQIDYQIQEDYHKFRKYFIALMMILPSLLAVLIVWLGYYCYGRFYLLRQRKKIYE